MALSSITNALRKIAAGAGKKTDDIVPARTVEEDLNAITGPGEKFRNVQLAVGDEPVFAVVDAYDDSVVNVVSGRTNGRDYSTMIQSVKQPGDDSMLRELLNQDVLNNKQYNDAVSGPSIRIDNPTEHNGIIELLKERGLSLGSTAKSGAFSASPASRLKSSMAIAQSPSFDGLTGSLRGSRVTGAKGGSMDDGQALNIAQLRSRAQRAKVAPVEDLSKGERLPDEFSMERSALEDDKVNLDNSSFGRRFSERHPDDGIDFEMMEGMENVYEPPSTVNLLRSNIVNDIIDVTNGRVFIQLDNIDEVPIEHIMDKLKIVSAMSPETVVSTFGMDARDLIGAIWYKSSSSRIDEMLTKFSADPELADIGRMLAQHDEIPF
jgi:hypothetical protein